MRPVLIFVSCSVAIVACGRCEHPSMAAHLFRSGSQHRTEKAHQMWQSSTAGLVTLLTTYGYWAIFACIAIESTGIPFPGETMLLVAAIFAGTTHRLSIPWSFSQQKASPSWGITWGFGWAARAASACCAATGGTSAWTSASSNWASTSFAGTGGKWSSSDASWRCCACGPRFLLFNAPSGHYVGQPGGTGRLFPGRHHPSADETGRDWRSRAGRTPQHRFFPLLADTATPPGRGGRTSTARSPG